MQLVFENEIFMVRRDASGITLECDNPRPHRKPSPGERVPAPKAKTFTFEDQAYTIWRDPWAGIQFGRDHRAAKPAKPAPVARDAKPKSVPINITSIVADRQSLPHRTGISRRVAFNEPTSVPRAESVTIRGRAYWVWESGGKLHIERAKR